MVPESPEGRVPSRENQELVAGEVQQYRQYVRRAFELAKSGAASQGYLLLRRGRELAAASAAQQNAELLRRWDVALQCYERWAPSPLDRLSD